MSFLTDSGKQALADAIERVEARTSAELVVVVRASSGEYLGNDLLVGFGAAIGLLGFMLYAPPVFGLATILLGPVVAVATVVATLRVVPGLRALFIADRRSREAVDSAAQACFARKGVHLTRDRTGVLIYASMLEQRVVVLADGGIGSAVAEDDEWRATCRAIEQVFADEGDASVLAERIAALAPVLARACPRRADDIDELSNEVDT